jgi:hypothetical protein
MPYVQHLPESRNSGERMKIAMKGGRQRTNKGEIYGMYPFCLWSLEIFWEDLETYRYSLETMNHKNRRLEARDAGRQ